MTKEIPKEIILQEAFNRSCLVWAADSGIRTEKAIPLNFKSHRFLKGIYDDWTPILTVRKASQIGFSTMMINKTLWAAKNKGWNIIYTLPTFGGVHQFVPSKVNPIIKINLELTEWTKDKDSTLQKQVGQGFIYYRGAFSQKTEKEKMESGVGIMLTSDLNVHDESDRSDQTILEQYESRLGASRFKGKWYFSNPTVPKTLTQKLWDKSDQKHWFVKCSHCKEWQYLDYWKNILNDKFVCAKCHREITDRDRINGQWVQKYPGRKNISGYWISHLIAPWISAKEIQHNAETKTKQYFYNFVLGLPYIGSDIIVDQDTVLRNIDTTPNFLKRNVIGVDQGLKKHFVLGNKQGIFKIGVFDSWDDIELLIRKYDVETAVFDALPDLTAPRKLRNKYPGKIFLNYYKEEVKKADFIIWDDKTHTVYCDRSKIIQQNVDEMIDRKIRFQMKPKDLKEYIEHWGNIYKISEENRMGIERDVWESNGEDHFVHATNYFRIALERAGGETTKVMDWSSSEKTADVSSAIDIKKMIKNQEAYNEF
jgi:hypothetical protein